MSCTLNWRGPLKWGPCSSALAAHAWNPGLWACTYLWSRRPQFKLVSQLIYSVQWSTRIWIRTTSKRDLHEPTITYNMTIWAYITCRSNSISNKCMTLSSASDPAYSHTGNQPVYACIRNIFSEGIINTTSRGTLRKPVVILLHDMWRLTLK
jgi:hypothetical protein